MFLFCFLLRAILLTPVALFHLHEIITIKARQIKLKHHARFRRIYTVYHSVVQGT